MAIAEESYHEHCEAAMWRLMFKKSYELTLIFIIVDVLTAVQVVRTWDIYLV